MTDPYADPRPSHPALAGAATDERIFPVAVYILYLFGWAGGVSLFIGFVMAYVLKGGAGPMARSHYVFQIRTVWISLVWAFFAGLLILVGLPLTLVLVGFLFLKIGFIALSLIGVWVLVRCLVGLIHAARGEAYPRPRAWLI